MGKEYEVKVRVGDLSSVRARIEGLGGELISTHTEEDYYVDLRNCVSEEYRDVVFRIRVRDVKGVKEGELTVKGPRKASRTLKIREEVSVRVERPYELIEILESLTFKTLKVLKTREVYRLRNFKIFLDNVPGLGTFVEVELEGVEDVGRAEEEVSKILEELGVGREVISKSYAEMMLEVMGCGR